MYTVCILHVRNGLVTVLTLYPEIKKPVFLMVAEI